jgi:uncharacterized membrane protein
MKHRHVFSAPNLSTAHAALQAARAAGVPDPDLSLIARSDIELQSIPDDRLDGTTDTVPAALRGAVGGGAVGLLAGVLAAVVPPLGITVAGAALIAALGAAVGTWTAALIGSSVPSEVRRTFEEEIAAGRILLVIDAERDALAAASQAAVAAGARMLPFEGVSAVS